jgi:antitoxin (DNA-binding transcriptional repressor) of toxin-antitoxin stability system
MNEQITAEELAADLKSALDRVRTGDTLTVIEDGDAVARVLPPADDPIIPHDPALRLEDFKPGPRPKRLDFNAEDWLMFEREEDRSGARFRR